MQRTTLGRTKIEVSAWSLGTMTWGSQTPVADAHAQMDRALAAGIDFVDTAEMYPVNPVTPETIGRTEEIMGDWIARTGRRDDIVLATKALPGNGFGVRDGAALDPAGLRAALEGSLRRLRTDCVDLYQIHWPDRGSFHFRRNWTYDPTGQDTAAVRDYMAELAGTLADLAAEGKLRAFGLSNESAWGTVAWNAALDAAGAPRVASMQNEYSLLCRQYDTDLAETAHHEGVTLLAFSPLAAGLLTGKYQDGAVPDASRMALVPELGGRKSARVFDAVAAYLDIAARHGLDPVHMALAWTRSRPFATIPIFGATTTEQLDRILAGTGTVLSDEVQNEIAAAHKAHPMPY